MSENIVVFPIWEMLDNFDNLPVYNDELKSNTIVRFEVCPKCNSDYCKCGTIWKKEGGFLIIDVNEECQDINYKDEKWEKWEICDKKRKNIGDDIEPFTRFQNKYLPDFENPSKKAKKFKKAKKSTTNFINKLKKTFKK